MTTDVEELAAAIEPIFAGLIVAWPYDVSPVDEIVWQAMLASPRARRRVVETVRLLVERAEHLTEFVTDLDRLALRFGLDDDAETCAALLAIGDVVRDWGDQA
jgi:hypothetical protein